MVKKFAIPFVAIALYAYCLTLPAILLSNGFTWTGIMVLKNGFLVPPWMANPLGILALCFMLARWYKTSLVFAAFATLFGLYSLTYLSVSFDMDEAGVNHASIIDFGAGFYVWIASFVLTFLYSSYMSVQRKPALQ